MKTHHQTKVLEVYLNPYFVPRTILLTVCNRNSQNVIILNFSSAEKKYNPPKHKICNLHCKWSDDCVNTRISCFNGWCVYI